MLRMCVYMHSRFVENHPIRILEDGPLISKGVLSQEGATILEVPACHVPLLDLPNQLSPLFT
jgi:hypothetical protein